MITKDQIKEIEDDLKALTTKARALSPDRHGHEQQTAIRSFQKSCLGLAGFEIGELKNAFEMGDRANKIKPDEKLRQEIEDISKVVK